MSVLSNPDELVLTAEEVAARLRVSTETVRRQVRAGEWPALRINRALRFGPDEVRQIEQAMKSPPPRRPRRSRTKNNDVARALAATA